MRTVVMTQAALQCGKLTIRLVLDVIYLDLTVFVLMELVLLQQNIKLDFIEWVYDVLLEYFIDTL